MSHGFLNINLHNKTQNRLWLEVLNSKKLTDKMLKLIITVLFPPSIGGYQNTCEKAPSSYTTWHNKLFFFFKSVIYWKKIKLVGKWHVQDTTALLISKFGIAKTDDSYFKNN